MVVEERVAVISIVLAAGEGLRIGHNLTQAPARSPAELPARRGSTASLAGPWRDQEVDRV